MGEKESVRRENRSEDARKTKSSRRGVYERRIRVREKESECATMEDSECENAVKRCRTERAACRGGGGVGSCGGFGNIKSRTVATTIE